MASLPLRGKEREFFSNLQKYRANRCKLRPNWLNCVMSFTVTAHNKNKPYTLMPAEQVTGAA
jgi:hypothetical protein